MISDSNPERRNLVITSVSFIVFCAAGGHIVTPNIHLSVVNVVFSHPVTLIIFAWVLLFWFAFRYWITTKDKSLSSFNEQVRNAAQVQKYNEILKNITGMKENEPDGFQYAGAGNSNRFCIRIQYRPVISVMKNTEGKITNAKYGDEISEARLTPIHNARYFWGLTLKWAIINEDISSYVAPYILFLLAVVMGLYRAF